MIGGEGPCLSVGTKITLLSMATEHGQDESFPDLPIPRGLRTFLHVSIMDQHASRHRFFSTRFVCTWKLRCSTVDKHCVQNNDYRIVLGVSASKYLLSSS